MAVCVPKQREVIEDKRFSKITGIKEKRVSDGLDAIHYGHDAARALDLKGVKFIIFCSQTHSYLIPFNSNILQDQLDLPCATGTLDINTGCTGFVLGLMTAYNIAQSMRGNVLLVIGDTLSKTTGPHDPASEKIFGDAVAACIVEYNPSKYQESYFSLYSDGGKGFAIRMYHAEVPRITMDGDAVLDFALKRVPKAVTDMEYNLPPCENYIFHQSNMMILKEFQRQLVPYYAQMPTSIENYGNTSGASIPLTMTLNKSTGTSMLIGYGSGLSWGVAVTDLTGCEYHDIIEI